MIHRACRWKSLEQLFWIPSIANGSTSHGGCVGSARQAAGDAKNIQGARKCATPSVATWAWGEGASDCDVVRSSTCANKGAVELPFHSANRWQDVYSVLNVLHRAPTIHNIEAALTRLKKLPDPPPQEFLDRLLLGVLNLLPTLRLQHFANILHACFRLGYLPKAVLGAMAQALTKKPAEQFWTFPLVVYTLGTICGRQLGQAPAELFPGQGLFLSKVGSECVTPGTVSKLTAWQLSNLLYGIARLQGETAPLVYPVLEDLARSHRKEMMADEKAASEVLWSLSRLQVEKRYSKPVLRAFEWAVEARGLLTKFSDQGIATVVYSLGRLQHKSRYLGGELLKEVADRAVQKRFTERQIANIWHGLAGIGVQDPSLLQAFAEETAAEDRLSCYSHEGISAILFSLGRLQYGDKTLALRLLSRIEDGKHLAAYSERAIANLVFSVGELKLGTAGVPSLRALVASMKSRRFLHQWTEQGLSNVFYGLVEAGFREADFMQWLVQEIVDRWQIGNLSSQRILSFVVGCAKLLGKEPPVCNHMALTLTRELCKDHRLRALRPNDLASLLSAAAKLDLSNSSIYGCILDEIRGRNLCSFSTRHLCSIVYSMRKVDGVDLRLLDSVLIMLTTTAHLDSITQHHLANIVFHLGQHGSTGNRVGMDVLLERIVHTGVGTFTESQLAKILYGVGHWGCSKSEAICIIAQEFCDPRRLASAKTQDLALAFFALGQLEYGGTAEVEALVQEITATQRLQEFHPVGLSMIIRTLVPLKCTNGYVFGTLIKEVAKNRNLKRFTDGALANVVDVFGCLGIGDEKCLWAVTNELFTPRRAVRLKDSQWLEVLRGLAMLGFRHVEALGIFSKVLDDVRLRSMAPDALYSLSAFVAEYTQKVEKAKASDADRIMTSLLAPRTIAKLAAPQVAGIMRGFWRTGCMTADAVHAAIDKMTDHRILPQLLEFDMAALVHQLDVLPPLSRGRLSSRVTSVVLDGATLPMFSQGGLLSVLRCYRSNQQANSTALCNVITELLRPHRLDAMSTEEAVSAFRHLVRLRWGHKGMGKLLERATREQADPGLTEAQMSILAASLTECELYDERFLRLLLAVAHDEERLERFSTPGLQSVILFLGAIGMGASIVDCFIAELLKPSRLAGMSQADVRSSMRAVHTVGRQDAFDVEELIRASSRRASRTVR
ncbi:unnamed protein product [Ostreobium quekettii]|uniref:Uncharacterized protein n=1 Tax=Ostreobium quekettii TaxID=121088 RepID=A0A8S1IS00_9CHLO|nr:unnamed protein product [Ostreobium quekettii]|eukprot:evm.model.scf_37.2 EVM.evm.TU.scf_37.2   scf_37:8286-12219(-)